jgi:tRNA threonylcarbamoyl adenosine modification protein YeaZ
MARNTRALPSPTILALDSALAHCSTGLVTDGVLRAARQQDGGRGQAALLPVMVAAVLDEAGVSATDLDLIAVTVGPGSFTGIRAGLALAHGIALGAGVPIVGVTVGEALADALPHLGARQLWSVIDSRRGRVFLERGGSVLAYALDNLPRTTGAVAVAGDAAVAVAARLAARDTDVMLTDARLPTARHVAMVGARRLAGDLPPRAAQPLYVDPPEARLPQGGLRPAPVP